MKIKIDSLYLKAGVNVKDGDKIVLLDEGKYNPTKFGKALNFKVRLEDGEEKIYTANATTQKNLINEFGDDSANWKDKTLKAWVVRQVVKGKMTNVLYLTPENWTEPVRDAEVIDEHSDIPIIEEEGEINVKDIPY